MLRFSERLPQRQLDRASTLISASETSEDSITCLLKYVIYFGFSDQLLNDVLVGLSPQRRNGNRACRSICTCGGTRAAAAIR